MAGWLPKLWNRGYARASLIGKEATFNPAPAAAYMLKIGVKRPTMWSQGAARRRVLGRFRRTRTHNPLPAFLAAGGLLGGLGKRFRPGSEKRAAGPAATLLAAARNGNATAAWTIVSRTTFGIAKERAVWQAAMRQLDPAVVTLVEDHDELGRTVDNSNPESAAATALVAQKPTIDELKAAARTGRGQATVRNAKRKETGVQEAGELLGDVLDSATRGERQPRRRSRYGEYREYATDAYTASGALRRGRARRAPRGRRMGGGRLARAGAAGALATAGVAIGGFAAGYFIGTELNKYLAGRALSAEQAGVAAARAHRAAVLSAQEANGGPLSRAQLNSLKEQYRAALVQLGYDPVTFTRKRSTVERFFTGQEETDEDEEE